MALITNLISYYSLNGNSNDAVSGHNNGSDTFITYSNGNGIIPQGAGFTKALSSIITTAGTENVGADASIQCWFKTTLTGYTGALFSMKNSNISFRLHITTDGTVAGYSEDSNHDDVTTVSSSSGYNDGNWHHAVFTRASTNTYILYIDGAQANTGSGGQTGNHNSSKPQIGGAQSDYFEGAIDECGYWSRTLSPSEVTQLYNAGAGLAYPLPNTYTQELTETVTYTGTLLKQCSRIFAETATYTDTLLKQVLRVFSETLTATATFTGGHVFLSTLNETVSYVDTLIKTTSRVFTQTVTYTDTLDLLHTLYKTLSETVSHVDTLVVKIVARILTETLSFLDTLIRHIRTGRPTATSSKEARPTDSSSKEPRPS